MKIPRHDPDLIVPTDGWENYSWTNGDRADSARKAIIGVSPRILTFIGVSNLLGSVLAF